MPTLADAVKAATLERIRRPGEIDAVVVGAGATGGLAAQLLTEAGLRVLLLDAGINRTGPSAWWRALKRRMRPAAFERDQRRRQPVQSQCYAWDSAPDAFVDDHECPYTVPPDRPFLWFRARQLGGRLAIPRHGRQYYRFSAAELSPGDGLSPPWPLNPGELDPWYSMVERQLRLKGCHEPQRALPDSEIAIRIDPSANERHLMDAISRRWPDAQPILGRYGVPSPTLDFAARTGRLLVRTGAVVRSIEVDGAGRFQAVRWVDTLSRSEVRVSAPLAFLCASALESTRVLMLSGAPGRSRGLGAGSGVLGHYLMDHIRVRFRGRGGALPEPDGPAERGRCIYLARFDARADRAVTGRGYGVQLHHAALDGAAELSGAAFGEMLPRQENQVTIDESRTDRWGIPVLRIDCAHDAVDRQRMSDAVEGLRDLVACLGGDADRIEFEYAVPGSANHECGTARMGTDPASSVVDGHNECWDARGLFLTDAACFPSQGFQNPTLTLLALTARACHHALSSSAGIESNSREGDAA
jgi:choline dehydrogenase-like flavoprotein